MWRPISALGTWLTKVESWWTLGVMLMGTGAFAWLGHQWDYLSAQGWAAVLMIAILLTSLVIVAFSLAYLAISRYESHRDTGGPAQFPTMDAESQQLAAFANRHLLSAIDRLEALLDDATIYARPNGDTVGILLRDYIFSVLVARRHAAQRSLENEARGKIRDYGALQRTLCDAVEAYRLTSRAADEALQSANPSATFGQVWHRWKQADKEADSALSELVGTLPDNSTLRMRLRLIQQRFSHLP